MRFIKIGGLIAIALVALLAVIGVLAPDSQKQGSEASTDVKAATGQVTSQSKAVSVKVPERPVDQCLDGVCIGAEPLELAALKWSDKKNHAGNSGLNGAQLEMVEAEEKRVEAECVKRQAATWGSKSGELCRVLLGGDTQFWPVLAKVEPLQLATVLRFFGSESQAVCQYAKDPYRFYGDIETESGKTRIEFRFGTDGKLRVQNIEKKYAPDNEATANAIVTKLNEKHPYLKADGKDGVGQYFAGDAAWGGSVKLIVNNTPTITLLGAKADFDPTQIAACNAAKPVNVQ